MKKITYIFILFVFFITGIAGKLFAQTAEGEKTRVIIDRFNPLIESPENSVFENNLPSLIRLSFINQKSYIFLENGDEIMAKITGKKKAQSSAQYTYQVNKTQISEITDVVLFGDYSITAEEIYIIPKLYDTKNDKFFTLQSIKISDFEYGLNPGKFEALITSYRDKLRSISKSNSNLKKVGLRLASNQGAPASSFEESLYKSFVVMATKSLDTTSLVALVPLEKMKTVFLKTTPNAELAKEVGADVVYNILFENVTEDVIQVNLELYFTESNKTFRFNTFTFDLYGNRIIENDLVHDFYGLFKEIVKDGSFDLALLGLEGTTPLSYEEIGYDLYLQQNYFISNLYYYKALNLQPEEATKPYDYYMLGMNSDALNQPERAIEFYLKSLTINPDYKFSWWGLAYSSYSLGYYADAAEAWLKTYELDPEYEPANLQYNVGLSYYGLENYDTAIVYFQTAIAKDYLNKEDAYFYIAICYEAILDYEGAIDFYKNALALNPDDYYNKVYLAYFNYHAGSNALYDGFYKQAADYLDEAHSIYVDNLDYDEYLNSLIFDYNNLRRLAHLYLNDYEGAWEITQQGISDGQFDLYSVYYENGNELTFVISNDDEKRYNEIIRYYLLHTEMNPNDSIIDQVYNSIGYYYSLLGDIETCALYFEKALEFNPDNLSAQLNIMELYLVLDQYDDLFTASETILSSLNMKSQMEANNGIHSMFYFLLLNAKVVTNKNYDSDKANFEKYLQESDFNTGWDFSLYEYWLNNLANEETKNKLSEFYGQLKERINQSLLSQ